MTAKEVFTGLSNLGYPVAYSHFAEGNMPAPPFITYLFPETDNFSADGVVFQDISELEVQLYSDKKDLEAEAAISQWLTSNGLFFDKQEYFIESEKLIQVIFSISMLGGN